MRFANLSPQDRTKRKAEALEQLKRVFKKLDHDVNVEEYTRVPAHSIEELHHHLQTLQIQYLHLQQKLRSYESCQSLEEANDLEAVLHKRLQEVCARKQLLESTLCMAPYSTGLHQQPFASNIMLQTSIEQNPAANWETEGDRQLKAMLPSPFEQHHMQSNWDNDSHRQLNTLGLANFSNEMYLQSNLL